jgi:hypothetical protein|tara:strand:- start:13702 stop:13890 length:189 start_codon:yes stop_codon:yes gene_type:complete
MFQGEPDPNASSAIRAIRLLPFALAASLGAYFLLQAAGFGGDICAVVAAIAGGWTLGRLTRR